MSTAIHCYLTVCVCFTRHRSVCAAQRFRVHQQGTEGYIRADQAIHQRPHRPLKHGMAGILNKGFYRLGYFLIIHIYIYKTKYCEIILVCGHKISWFDDIRGNLNLWIFKYSQTCVKQPPKGSTKSGCLRQVAAYWRWISEQN